MQAMYQVIVCINHTQNVRFGVCLYHCTVIHFVQMKTWKVLKNVAYTMAIPGSTTICGLTTSEQRSSDRPGVTWRGFTRPVKGGVHWLKGLVDVGKPW